MLSYSRQFSLDVIRPEGLNRNIIKYQPKSLINSIALDLFPTSTSDDSSTHFFLQELCKKNPAISAQCSYLVVAFAGSTLGGKSKGAPGAAHDVFLVREKGTWKGRVHTSAAKLPVELNLKHSGAQVWLM